MFFDTRKETRPTNEKRPFILAKYGKVLNNAMLAGMSTQRHDFSQVENNGSEHLPAVNPFSSPKDYTKPQFATQDDIKKKFKWLI